ncbi:Uncharacterized protein Rs2_35521 [Raphanus sativus]|nr:Uncharacterized protein Rs2_35521 [Raphanus sativus]
MNIGRTPCLDRLIPNWFLWLRSICTTYGAKLKKRQCVSLIVMILSTRTIYPVPDKSEWNVPDHIKELQIIPPKKLTGKGRKKVNRNPSGGERRKRTQNTRIRGDDFMVVRVIRRKNGCKYFKWFDVEDGIEWQKMALIEAWDEIREQSRVIEQLTKPLQN